MHRFLTLALLAACTPDAPFDPGADPGDPDAGGPGSDTLPASSVCVDPDLYGMCAAVEAESWNRAETWSLAVEDEVGSEVVLRDGRGESWLRMRGDSWVVPWGLSARPGGGWVIAAATLRGSVTIGEERIDLPHAYAPFVVAVSEAGAIDWVYTHEGVTADRILVATRADDTVVLAGDLMGELTLGDTTLGGPAWVFDVFVASLTREGEVAWAIEPPDAAEIGDFRLSMLELATDGEARIHGVGRGTLAFGGDTLRVEEGAEAPVVARVSPAGAWLGVALLGAE